MAEMAIGCVRGERPHPLFGRSSLSRFAAPGESGRAPRRHRNHCRMPPRRETDVYLSCTASPGRPHVLGKAGVQAELRCTAHPAKQINAFNVCQTGSSRSQRSRTPPERDDNFRKDTPGERGGQCSRFIGENDAVTGAFRLLLKSYSFQNIIYHTFVKPLTTL